MAALFRPFSGGLPVTTKRPRVDIDAGVGDYTPEPITPPASVRHDTAAPIPQRIDDFFRPAQSAIYDTPVIGGALRSVVESPFGKAFQFGTEAFNRGQEIAQGAVTAAGEALLEKFGGGPGGFRSAIAARGNNNIFDDLGAAGDVVSSRRGELPSVDLPIVGRQDLLSLQGALLPLPSARGALRPRAAAAVQTTRALPAPHAPLALPAGKSIPMRGAIAMPPPSESYQPRPINAAAVQRRIAQGHPAFGPNVPLDAEQIAARIGAKSPAQRAVSEDLTRQVAARETARPLRDAENAVITAMRDIVDAPQGVRELRGPRASGSQCPNARRRSESYRAALARCWPARAERRRCQAEGRLIR